MFADEEEQATLPPMFQDAEEQQPESERSLPATIGHYAWQYGSAPVRAGLWAFEQLNRPQAGAQNFFNALLTGHPENALSDTWQGAGHLKGVRDWGPSLDVVDPLGHLIKTSTGIAEALTGQEAKFDLGALGKHTPYEMYKAPRDLVANTGLDPLLFYGLATKIPAVARGGAKIADVLASTRAGRVLGMRPSELNFGEFNRLASTVMPKARWAQQKAEEVADIERSNAIEALKNMRRGFGPPEPPREYAGYKVGDWIFAKDRLNYGQVEDIGDKTARVHFWNRAEGTEATVDLPLDELKALRKAPVGKAREDFQFPINYIEAFERQGVKPGLFGRYQEALKPLQRFKTQNDALFAENNRLRQVIDPSGRNLPQRANVEDETYQIMNRILDPRKSVRENIRGGELAGYAKEARKGLHRTLYRWEDPEGRVIYKGWQNHPDLEATGRRIDQVGVDPETGLPMYRFFAPEIPQGIPVRPRQLSLKEAQKVAPGRKWVDDPFDALALAQQRMHRENAFLQFLEQGKSQGWLRDAKGNTDPLFEQLKTPGLEHLAARKAVVGRINQMNKLIMNPERVLKAFDAAGDEVHKGLFQALSRVARGWKDYRDMWAQGMLMDIGFHTNNASSNIPLAFVGGQIPDYSIGKRFGQGLMPSMWNFLKSIGRHKAADRFGKGTVLSEYKNPFTNADLFMEGAKRGLTESWSQSETRGMGLAGRYAVPLSERLFPGEGKASTVARKALGVWETLSNANLEYVGKTVENQARFAVMIDWLKRNVPKGAEITSRDLDRAVYHAKDAIFDYLDLPSMISTLRNFNPYISWHYNILRRTLKDLVQRPQRLARSGRYYSAVWDLLTEDDTKNTRDWMKGQMPVKGLRGWEFPRSKEGFRNIMLMGRMFPYTEINDWMTRPYETAIGQLNPVVKAGIEIPHNKSTFFNSDIDQAVADLPEEERGFAFGQAMINPIKQNLFGIPAPYSSRNRVMGLNVPDAWQYLWDTFSPFSRVARRIQGAAETLGAAMPNTPIINRLANPGRAAQTPSEFAFNTFTGGKFYPLDEEKNLQIRQNQYNKTLQNFQNQLNIAANKGRWDEVKRIEGVIEEYQRKMEKAF